MRSWTIMLPVSLLSQMKKNYIERLKEYQGRTSLSSKRALYSRKLLKKCYQEDKENLEPPSNTSEKARNQNSQKRQKGCKVSALVERQKAAEEFQQKEQADIEINPYACQLHPNHHWEKLFLVESSKGRKIVCEKCSLSFLSKTVFLDGEEAREGHGQLSHLKVQLVKLQRLLQEKVQEEIQYCREYYNLLRNQLQIMQSQSISYIRQSYLRSKKAIMNSNQNIQKTMNDHSNTNIPESLREVQIELAVVKLDDSILEKARKHLRELDLRSLAFLQPLSQLLPNEKQYSTRQTRRPSDCSLSCSEKIEKERRSQVENEISFHCQGFSGGWQANLIEPIGCPEVSPSFKLF